jgi:hypothetical protein
MQPESRVQQTTRKLKPWIKPALIIVATLIIGCFIGRAIGIATCTAKLNQESKAVIAAREEAETIMIKAKALAEANQVIEESITPKLLTYLDRMKQLKISVNIEN